MTKVYVVYVRLRWCGDTMSDGSQCRCDGIGKKVFSNLNLAKQFAEEQAARLCDDVLNITGEPAKIYINRVYHRDECIESLDESSESEDDGIADHVLIRSYVLDE